MGPGGPPMAEIYGLWISCHGRSKHGRKFLMGWGAVWVDVQMCMYFGTCWGEQCNMGGFPPWGNPWMGKLLVEVPPWGKSKHARKFEKFSFMAGRDGCYFLAQAGLSMLNVGCISIGFQMHVCRIVKKLRGRISTFQKSAAGQSVTHSKQAPSPGISCFSPSIAMGSHWRRNSTHVSESLSA